MHDDASPRVPRPLLIALGAAFIVASLVMIVNALQRPPRPPQVALVTAPPATPTPLPTSAPTPRPTATPTPRPTATPTPRPTATPTPRPTVRPASRAAASAPSSQHPAPRAAQRATPAPRKRTPATPDVVVITVRDPVHVDCERAVRYEEHAWQVLGDGSALEAYNAVVEGLASNRDCDDPPAHLVNEAFLYAARAPAEFALRFGDWRADLARSDDLLHRCEADPALRATPAQRRCRAQLQNNDLARRRMSAAARPGGS